MIQAERIVGQIDVVIQYTGLPLNIVKVRVLVQLNNMRIQKFNIGLVDQAALRCLSDR